MRKNYIHIPCHTPAPRKKVLVEWINPHLTIILTMKYRNYRFTMKVCIRIPFNICVLTFLLAI